MTALSEHARRRGVHRRLAALLTAVACVAAAITPVPGLGVQVVLFTVVVLALGMPHGALDAVVALRLSSRLGRARFLAGYLGLAGLTAGSWLVAPGWALALFLACSLVHFGRGDAENGHRGALEVGVRGALPLLLPVAFHPAEAALLFAWLARTDEAGLEAGVRAALPALVAIWALGAIALAARELRAARAGTVVELCVLVAGFALLPPLLGFALYFGAWHSLRHLIALDVALGLRERLVRTTLLRRGLPVLALSLLLALGVYAALAVRPADPQAAVEALFVLLAALTVPHMAVTLLVDHALEPIVPETTKGALRGPEDALA